MSDVQVLILPGWRGSGPDHWQTRWEARYGYQRVDQHDWQDPRRGDWLARLDEVVLSTEAPVVLVAHSLGCVCVAAWSKFSRYTAKVKGALLVAPADVDRADLVPQLPGWAPVVRDRLPFASVVLASSDDPFCTIDRAQGLAQDWGSQFVDCGAYGHLNADSDLGDWSAGHDWLMPWLPSRV